ncbi:MAG: Single-stranded-DNA-specific exonuclease RecJ [Fimbriimonadaceae bacterium]|nr:Single-stranded-DNA-specific exonuclease RecJ [Fimbriimonadaceae bacterium]
MMSLAQPTTARWLIGDPDPALVAAVRQTTGMGELAAIALVQKGLVEPEAIYDFLHPSLDDLHPPQLLPDYEKARDEILGAKERGDRIYVHGDYDVDGLTSATLLTRFLRKIGCDVEVHVPHRMKEGYGIHEDSVYDAHRCGAKLFLTCDCGSNSHDQIALAHQLGMRVVVTDHHELSRGIPEAEAVVNPHRIDNTYPFPHLSGVGVAFKLAGGLAEELGYQLAHFYRAYLDLVVLGTVADVMPLVGENRIIARYGLEQLRQTKKVGLKALMQVANVTPDRPIRAGHIGFQLAPRLNAIGRIDDAAVALRLLMADDPEEAWNLAVEVDQANTRRRSEQERILEEALLQAQELGVDNRFVIVVGAEGWHPGIVGIVAGKLTEKLHRPAFVAGIDGETGMARGSARSIAGFHLADAIEAHRPLFTSGGGHELAAGFSCPADGIEALRNSLDLHARGLLRPEDLVPTMRADAEIDADRIDFASIAELSKLEPFGLGNAQPKFVSRNFVLSKVSVIKDVHLFLDFLTPGGKCLRWKSWSGAEAAEGYRTGARFDALYSLGIDSFQGIDSIGFEVCDLREVA